ncbi:MAG: serine/threonine protein kinase [Planctomycetales bacterium]|nr:serine/threonine protein kinase [Planctomycetales bacterium]
MESKPQQLDEVIAEYLLAIETGVAVDTEEWTQRQPTHRAELQRFFADRQAVERITERFRFLMATPATWSPASDTLGEFRLGDMIGRGGMGVVYRAEQTSLNRAVAVKVLPRIGGLSARQLQRFQHEVRATALLSHPNIVPVHAFGCERGTCFCAMELVTGGSLADVVLAIKEQHAARNGRRAAELADRYRADRRAYYDDTARICCAVARALHCAHEQGIVHRDVKPANILLDETATPRLTDFGLARSMDSDGLTHTGELVGTLRYMSPEQIESKSLVDFRTDVYSLGVTLYELLTLKSPFESESHQRMLQAIVTASPRSLRRIDPTIPADLETIVLKSLAKEPHNRYATAADLADDLERFLARRPILGRRSSRGGKLASPRRKRPVVARRNGPWQKQLRTARNCRNSSANPSLTSPYKLATNPG